LRAPSEPRAHRPAADFEGLNSCSGPAQTCPHASTYRHRGLARAGHGDSHDHPKRRNSRIDSLLPITDLFPDAVTRLRGDVDGDRHFDTVTTEAEWLADDTCRARLVVETNRNVFRRHVDPLSGLLIAPPGLAALVQLDRSPGLEVAVVIWRGASTAFLDVYGVRGNRLTRVTRDAFAYAGSVVNRSGVDCARKRGAVLVASQAEFRLGDERYHVRRVFYALRAGVLRRLPSLTERFRVRFTGILRFPELANQVPFPSCTVVEGAS
jgi:hypothetical protein